MSTTVRPLHMPFALIVYPTMHKYVNGVDPLHSMRPCLWSLSNPVFTILWSFGPFRRFTVVPVFFHRLGLTFCAICAILLTVLRLVSLLYVVRLRIVKHWGLISVVLTVLMCAQ